MAWVTAVARVRSLAQELLHTMGMAKKKKKLKFIKIYMYKHLHTKHSDIYSWEKCKDAELSHSFIKQHVNCPTVIIAEHLCCHGSELKCSICFKCHMMLISSNE